MSKSNSSDGGSHTAAKLDDNAIRKIGEKLREQYDEVASEPVPDRFAELLSQLEASDGSPSSDKEGGK